MADTKSVTSGGTATSDAVTVPSTAVAGRVICKADNAGTPASGDVAKWFQLTRDDPDNDTTDEDTGSAHGQYLGVLDTNANDPAVGGAWPLKLPADSLKLYVENDGASSMTVSAVIKWLAADGTRSETQVQWT